MPTVSEAQRRYLYARFGAAWAKRHHYDNKGRLPEHVKHAQAGRKALRGLAK